MKKEIINDQMRISGTIGSITVDRYPLNEKMFCLGNFPILTTRGECTITLVIGENESDRDVYILDNTDCIEEPSIIGNIALTSNLVEFLRDSMNPSKFFVIDKDDIWPVDGAKECGYVLNHFNTVFQDDYKEKVLDKQFIYPRMGVESREKFNKMLFAASTEVVYENVKDCTYFEDRTLKLILTEGSDTMQLLDCNNNLVEDLIINQTALLLVRCIAGDIPVLFNQAVFRGDTSGIQYSITYYDGVIEFHNLALSEQSESVIYGFNQAVSYILESMDEDNFGTEHLSEMYEVLESVNDGKIDVISLVSGDMYVGIYNNYTNIIRIDIDDIISELDTYNDEGDIMIDNKNIRDFLGRKVRFEHDGIDHFVIRSIPDRDVLDEMWEDDAEERLIAIEDDLTEILDDLAGEIFTVVEHNGIVMFHNSIYNVYWPATYGVDNEVKLEMVSVQVFEEFDAYAHAEMKFYPCDDGDTALLCLEDSEEVDYDDRYTDHIGHEAEIVQGIAGFLTIRCKTCDENICHIADHRIILTVPAN